VAVQLSDGAKDTVFALGGSTLHWSFESHGDSDNWISGQHQNNT
jgi:hypothetical protein